MTTLRELLNGKDFDWNSGKIIYHETERYPGWDNVTTGKIIESDNSILDLSFDAGYGGPECPRFVADDKDKIYFPVQYDGATWVEFIYKDITIYLTEATPYPGG